jgi:hypothetical protein
MIHPYLVFDFEMQAVRSFAAELAKLKKSVVNPDQEFFSFMDKIVPSPHWLRFEFDKNATRKEKWLYLHSLGLGVVKIRSVTKGSPNQIQEVISQKPNIRYYSPNESMDFLINTWQPYRKLLPNEFFIKYLK